MADILSHLTRGAWIEMLSVSRVSGAAPSRTSHEVRGLKYIPVPQRYPNRQSHLTRGAWIEIVSPLPLPRRMICRTSHEVRGLKCAGPF